MDDTNEISRLIEAHLRGDLTGEESVQLDAWIQKSPENRKLFNQLTDFRFLTEELQKLYYYEEKAAWQKVAAQLPVSESAKTKKHFLTWNWKPLAIAASLIGAVCLGIYLLPDNAPKTAGKPAVVAISDIEAPKASKATIVLANGKIIGLDSLDNGVLARQGAIDIVKNASGDIVYKGTSAQMVYNMLFNPRGSHVVSMVLNDGTRVWLNSESTLRYPASFTGRDRKVQITGEAYFEVAKDASKTFTVEANGVMTQVLGTHFNVNTYADEPATQVTLLEGKVKVIKGSAQGILKPGQQAAISNLNGELHIASSDVEKAVAWKSGVFNFEEDDLPTVMRQLARWYDVEVLFSGKVNDDRYSGLISRDLSLLNVLQILNVAGVKYTLEGKKITIQINN